MGNSSFSSRAFGALKAIAQFLSISKPLKIDEKFHLIDHSERCAWDGENCKGSFSYMDTLWGHYLSGGSHRVSILAGIQACMLAYLFMGTMASTSHFVSSNPPSSLAMCMVILKSQLH